MEQIPDFKSLGAYCVCQITGDDFQIEVRTKIGKTRILLAAHSADEARTVAGVLRRHGVDVTKLEDGIQQRSQ